MAPWDAFEPKAKDLINLFDEPITLIDGQIKAFEEGRIAQKKALIEAIYTELVGDLADIIPLERIYNPKWENATTKEKAIREEVLAQATAARIALDTIRAVLKGFAGVAHRIEYVATVDGVDYYNDSKGDECGRIHPRGTGDEKADCADWRRL